MSATPWTVSERGDDDMLTYFISVGVDINRKNGMGVSPLHLAALHGHTSTVRLLVDAGALVNVRNSLNLDTPLHHAAEGNHREVVSLLLERGADPRATNKAGVSPVDLARENNHRIVLSLLRTGNDPVPCSLRCGATVTRRMAQAHMERTCPQREVDCRLMCGQRVAFSSQVTHEEKTCMEAEIDCWAGCGARLRRRDMRMHAAFVCPLSAKTKCRFGCTVLRSQQAQHEIAHLRKQAMAWSAPELGFWMFCVLRALTEGKSPDDIDASLLGAKPSEEASADDAGVTAPNDDAPASSDSKEGGQPAAGAEESSETKQDAPPAEAPASDSKGAEDVVSEASGGDTDRDSRSDSAVAEDDDDVKSAGASATGGETTQEDGETTAADSTGGGEEKKADDRDEVPDEEPASGAGSGAAEATENGELDVGKAPTDFVARLDGVKQLMQNTDNVSADDFSKRCNEMRLDGRMLALLSCHEVVDASLSWVLHIAGLSVSHRTLLQECWLKRIEADNSLVEAVASGALPLCLGSARQFKIVGVCPVGVRDWLSDVRDRISKTRRLARLVPENYHFISHSLNRTVEREKESQTIARLNAFAVHIEEDDPELLAAQALERERELKKARARGEIPV